MMQTMSTACGRYAHTNCNTTSCECVCHLYKPRMGWTLGQLLLLVLITWAAIFAVAFLVGVVFSVWM